ncbi:BNR-4 repeat-containing protein [Catenovulum agarivorans]|uniref:BNR-4 repeat-containing protein n=1 Tax=Catenovulum agarivorans TaxID=1172192 RepID=UPI0002DF569C|nr:BNR-4 repeat-containing protein [Catenovulum agarivorans]
MAIKISGCAALLLITATTVNAAVTLESDYKIADNALHFDGKRDSNSDIKDYTDQQFISDSQYHYHFGPSISAHGDSVKTYKHYVFMTWYRGGKDDRHVMLSRLNTKTNTIKTIEFPHRHTGYLGDWWIGESHNTIGLAVSPVNGTIHMVYDMHGYDDTTARKAFKDDYFRYSYSLAGTAEVSDDEFTLDKFVKDTSSINQGTDDYKHLTMTGNLADKDNFKNLTYPKFFTNTDGQILLYMRKGSSNNGAYVFNSYDAANQKWSTFTNFNYNNQIDKGNAYNWGLYGNMKYVNGKLSVGFQQRTNIQDDRYIYQNGIYYAYSDAPDGVGQWYNHKGDAMTWPLVNSDEIKIFEPGDLVTTQKTDQVYIVGNFDWTVTAKGDVHFVHRVRDTENKKDIYAHTYKPTGASDFITSTDFNGAEEIYTAGDDVYIIGLDGGNPYVEVTQGGTNKFTRVYQAANGDFDHGVVHVEQGKVYYYLMKNGSGSARPIHLQIIDLGIEKASVSFESNNINLLSGYKNLEITAKPVVDNSDLTIKHLTLYLDDELVSTIHNPPYQWTATEAKLQNLVAGSYQLKAVVTDSNDATNQALAELKVIDPTPSISFSASAPTLTEGYKNLSLTLNAASPVAERTIAKVTLFVNAQEVSAKTTAPYVWSEADTPLKALAVGTHTLKAVVTDSAGLTNETNITLTVKQQANNQPDANTGNSESSSGGPTNPMIVFALILLAVRRSFRI